MAGTERALLLLGGCQYPLLFLVLTSLKRAAKRSSLSAPSYHQMILGLASSSLLVFYGAMSAMVAAAKVKLLPATFLLTSAMTMLVSFWVVKVSNDEAAGAAVKGEERGGDIFLPSLAMSKGPFHALLFLVSSVEAAAALAAPLLVTRLLGVFELADLSRAVFALRLAAAGALLRAGVSSALSWSERRGGGAWRDLHVGSAISLLAQSLLLLYIASPSAVLAHPLLLGCLLLDSSLAAVCLLRSSETQEMSARESVRAVGEALRLAEEGKSAEAVARLQKARQGWEAAGGAVYAAAVLDMERAIDVEEERRSVASQLVCSLCEDISDVLSRSMTFDAEERRREIDKVRLPLLAEARDPTAQANEMLEDAEALKEDAKLHDEVKVGTAPLPPPLPLPIHSVLFASSSSLLASYSVSNFLSFFVGIFPCPTSSSSSSSSSSTLRARFFILIVFLLQVRAKLREVRSRVLFADWKLGAEVVRLVLVLHLLLHLHLHLLLHLLLPFFSDLVPALDLSRESLGGQAAGQAGEEGEHSLNGRWEQRIQTDSGAGPGAGGAGAREQEEREQGSRRSGSKEWQDVATHAGID
eukprot:451390-Hanusia_phi.AAC.1